MKYLEIAKEVFDIEVAEIQNVKRLLDSEFERAIELILSCKGKVVTTGVGKTGIIGQKMAATMASTGTHTVFMNSSEGLHGDLGIVNKEDVVIAISNSGNSGEILSIIPSLKHIGVKIIAITGNINSNLALQSDVILNTNVRKEACPMQLAPTSSTTVALVMADAIAVALIKAKNFKPENFAVYHPGGSLGRMLLTRVSDIMQELNNIAKFEQTSGIDEIVAKLTKHNLGAGFVISDDKIIGLITEGDIRRALIKKDVFFDLKAKDIMTSSFQDICKDELVTEALAKMNSNDKKLSVLPVRDKENNIIGLVRLQDLLRFE